MASPSPSSNIVEKARQLHDAIASRRDQTERERTVPEETIEAMKEAGLFRGLQPRRFGGLELPPSEWFKSMVEISRACASTGWIMGIIGVHPFEFALMSPELQEELWRDEPNTLVSSSYAPQSTVTKAPGGYRISGRHRSSSGVNHATWVVVGGSVTNDEHGPIGRIFVVPRSDYTVVDDWHTLGLSGTGSNSVVFDDVYVPEHRTITWTEINNGTAPGLAINDGPLYRVPHGAIYVSAGSGPAIGAARGGWEVAREQISAYADRLSGKGRAEQPWVQTRFAEAKSLIDDAEARCVRAFDEMYDLALGSEPITTELRVYHAYLLSQAARDSIAAFQKVFETRGASAVYSHNELQRFYRDLGTMRQHGTQDHNVFAFPVGQVSLGLEPNRGPLG